MLTKDAKSVLKQANKSSSGKISFEDLQKALNWNHDDVERVCNHLILEGYANSLRKQYTAGMGNAFGITLTEKGKHWIKYRLSVLCSFVAKSVITPIIVSVITTLVTMWLKNLL